VRKRKVCEKAKRILREAEKRAEKRGRKIDWSETGWRWFRNYVTCLFC